MMATMGKALPTAHLLVDSGMGNRAEQILKRLTDIGAGGRSTSAYACGPGSRRQRGRVRLLDKDNNTGQIESTNGEMLTFVRSNLRDPALWRALATDRQVSYVVLQAKSGPHADEIALEDHAK
jgi:cold shock CspA family protein